MEAIERSWGKLEQYRAYCIIARLYRFKNDFAKSNVYFERQLLIAKETKNVEDGEFIAGLRINQGDMLDGVTFVTNRREVHCGGRGGTFHRYTMLVCSRPSMRIVALAGTVNGVVARVGYYAKSLGWDIVGSFILLRQLVN